MHVGQLLVCEARVTYVGRTSIEVQVRVHAENPITREITHTNSAYVVYVALGPTASPPPRHRSRSRPTKTARCSPQAKHRQRHRTGR